MCNKNSRVCPVEIAGSLDNKIRKWLQNPQKILRPYIEKGMTVMDIGCGPGFFSVEMAEMVGENGRVIASDLQEGMLQKVRDKVRGTEFEKRIIIHRNCEQQIGVSWQVDFILLFYMVHEIENKKSFFIEIETMLNKKGKILIVEPIFHVSKPAFERTIRIAESAGFSEVEKPSILFSKTIVMKKG